jgi:CTP:molybdopterin cytidylyltransferase MocA
MPYLDIPTVKRILNEGKQGCIVEPCCRQKPGNPCLFSAAFREELLSLKEGESPRHIKARHPGKIRRVEVSAPLILEDIDDMEPLERNEGN